MKKITLLLTATCTLIAVTTFSQVRFSLTSGSALSNFFAKEDSETSSYDSKFGYTGGVEVDIPAGKHISFQSGLNFIQKGTGYQFEIMDQTYKYKLHVNSLEVPINLLYNTNDKKGNFFAGGGPSFTYGLDAGYEATFGGETEKEKLHFGNGEDEMKRIDAGVNLLTGYRFANGLFMAVNYNHGFTNLYNSIEPNDHSSVTTHYFGLRLGYQFGHKK